MYRAGLGFPRSLSGKESTSPAGHAGIIPGSGIPGEGNGNHSSILAWAIPWREKLGGLQFMGSQSQTQLNNSNIRQGYFQLTKC